MRADPPPKQAQRLRTLYDYDILDTPREADFDEIVALAAQICDAPISVINLIDKDRQWFKAEVGLGARETPLETSLCSHAILDAPFVEIPDTLNDPRMADNPLCAGEDGLRFYAGALLVAPNGLPLGTLCILDKEPRRLSAEQRNAVAVLSRQVMKQLDLRLALRRQSVLMSEADHRVKNSLQTLSAMIRMHARGLTDDSSRDALDAIQRRVQAVASLHGQLQHNTGRDEVEAGAFLGQVVDLLQETAPAHIEIGCRSDAIALKAGAASAMGLIVSEFVANAIKHGFPGEAAGEIAIDLSLVDGCYRLICQDNGIGSASGGLSRPGGLGQTLLSAAAAQLDGTLDTALTPEGSRLTLTF
ncbi:sensor histidine kinase [Sulfitobacter sp. PS-8MA]|uniref:sensor histidine kinase n=1 Tax=Sulfitobacter sp. PS-8MA TaxID=3237707 RepID=UPI0034C66379